MNEVKNPKKPLAYYYSITLIALLLFNIFVAPLLNRQHVEQTDYSTFMRMIAEKKIGKVDVDEEPELARRFLERRGYLWW